MRVTFTSRLLAAQTFASQLKPEDGLGSHKHGNITDLQRNGTAPGLELSLFGIGTFPLLNGVTTDITFTANSSNIALIIQPTDYAATYSYSILDVKASTPLQYEAVVVMTSDYYPFGMKMPGGLKAGAQPTGTYDVLEEEVVNYSNLVNSTVNASGDLEIDISGTGGSFSNLYGANSEQTVEPGEYIEWKAGDGPVSGNREFVGLSYVDGGTVYTSIKYAWYLYPNGRAYIFENGANVTSGVIYYTPGSVFRITRNGGNIVYTLDGIDYATIAEPPGSINDPMIVDISLINISGVITTIEDLMVAKWHTYAAYDPSDYISYINYEDYRYAYNGMEKDNEVGGNGNSYTTEFRQYDPRLGRWKSLDPLMHQFPWMSPYVAFDNNPIFYIDPYGLSAGEPEKAGTTIGEVQTGTDGKTEYMWEQGKDGPFWAKIQNIQEVVVVADADFQKGNYSGGFPRFEHDDGFWGTYPEIGYYPPDAPIKPTPQDISNRGTWQLKAWAAMCSWLANGGNAYNHFLNGGGDDYWTDFPDYFDDDNSATVLLDNAIKIAKKSAENLLTEDGYVEIYSKGYSVGDNDDDRFPYPDSEDWQKAIGGFKMWMSAKVKVVESNGVLQYSMTLTLHAEDRYNFNPGQQDIATGTPDDVNGRFELTGQGKQFYQYGKHSVHVTWSVKK